ILWTADATKTVYLKVRHFDGRGTGPYALRVCETQLSICGTVTDEDSMEPLMWAWVAAYAWDGAEWAVEDWTCTDEDGNYEFWSLTDGTYRLGFFSGGWEDTPPYTPEYYNNKTSVEDGDDVIVDGGTAPGTYDAALEIMEPSIQGTVIDDDWEDPIPGIAVTAYSWDADAGSWDEAAWGWTEYYGEYTIFGLKDGEWKIGFQMLWPYYEDEFWMPEFYNDQVTVDDSEWVETVDGQLTTGIDASLAAAPPAITGTVTASDSGDPLEDIAVVAYQYDEDADEWYGMWSVSTDSDGSYELMLGSGEYKIGFEDWNFEDGYHQSEYYNDQLHLKDAEVLETEIGSTLSAIDAELDLAVPSITGTVTNEATEELSGIFIEVYDWYEDEAGWYVSNWAETDDQGVYEVYGCVDGDHKVRFLDWDASDGYYADEFYDDAATLEDAKLVETEMLSTTTGVDAVLSEGVASITGRVTDEATSEGVEGVYVSALQYDADWDGWWDTAWAESDQDGEYALYNAGTGERVVMFWDWMRIYRTEFWDSEPQLESADIIDVARGITIEDIDASLIPAEPSITGVVTDADTGDPVDGVSVMAWVAEDEGWMSEWMTFTDADGQYSLVDLPTGTYCVGFADDWMMTGGTYVPEYYDDQPDLESADPVEVVDGAALIVIANSMRLLGGQHT
ncbi:MAG: carboxypeptidase regulatory-like domain-containing protein, partial [Coriobacteriia bacterium]|nr:carboxypeptidase regulatory-like domain-containing protein [Coriobacteriia bacterium]